MPAAPGGRGDTQRQLDVRKPFAQAGCGPRDGRAHAPRMRHDEIVAPPVNEKEQREERSAGQQDLEQQVRPCFLYEAAHDPEASQVNRFHGCSFLCSVDCCYKTNRFFRLFGLLLSIPFVPPTSVSDVTSAHSRSIAGTANFEVVSPPG
jgi:hypothetical protein